MTGAGQGIGRACALTLAKAGANVVVPDLDLATAEKTVADIKALGNDALAIRADVSKPEDVDRIFQQGLKKFGRNPFGRQFPSRMVRTVRASTSAEKGLSRRVGSEPGRRAGSSGRLV